MQTKFLSLFLLIGLMALSASQAFAQNTPAPQPAGRIIAARVRGEVYVTFKATSARTPLADTVEVIQGSSVTTGKSSSVVLVFSNGATINLGADSVLDIEQFTQDPFSISFNAASATEEPTASTTKLKLTRGELVSKVAKLNKAKGSSFTVGTPVGAAGIRGTTFRIVYRPDSTGKAFFSLTTLEGSVEVTLATGTITTAPVEVGANQEVEVTAEVTTDASGNVTVTLPSGASTLVATGASTSSTQQVAEAAQQIAQAVANVVITPPSSPPPVNPTPTAAPAPEPEPEALPQQPINPSLVSPSS